MRNFFTILVCLFSVSFVFANSGTFEYYLNTKLNGGASQYHGDYGGGTSFNGSNLGTISVDGGTLTIDVVGLKTWEDNGSVVSSATLYYRVTKQGDIPGSFTSFNLPQFGAKSGNNREWQANNVDLLDGLSDIGTYNVEVYFEASSSDGTLTRNNSGANYIATFSSTVALPVELTAFTAKKQGNNIQLNWATASEENNDFFTIEKSLDGENFKAIGTKAGAGNSLEAKEYSFIDTKPANGANYYRLKQTDFDGQFTYSEVVSVDFKTKVQATIFPNPTSERLTINTETQDVVNIRIFNVNGQMIYQNTQRIENQTEINLSELTVGTYFLMITNDATQATIYSSTFVKK
jgi:hypothetical protein